MNEKRLLILVAVLVVGLIGMIGVQAYHLQHLNSKIQQMQMAQAAPSITVNPPTTTSPPVPNLNANPSPPQSPSVDDFWSASGFGTDDWNPFQDIQQMQAHMDRMFNSTLNQFQASPNFGSIAVDSFFLPDLDLKDEGDNYVATLDLPGLEQSKVNIQVDGQTLTVSGERDETTNDEDQNGKIIRQERSVGNFERSIPLPGPVVQDDVEANYENGVLVITLPKVDQATTPRKVPLNTDKTNPSS